MMGLVACGQNKPVEDAAVSGEITQLKKATIPTIVIDDPLDNPKDDAFLTTWQFDKPNTTIVLPLPEFDKDIDQAPLKYDFTVDWGDGSSVDQITAYNDVDRQHTYAKKGCYTIKITGTVEGWNFNIAGVGSTPKYITEVQSFGKNIGFISLKGAFWNATNLKVVRGGDTRQVVSMKEMFHYATSLEYVAMDEFDFSNVESAFMMFAGTKNLKCIDFSKIPNSKRFKALKDIGGMFGSSGVEVINMSSAYIDLSKVQYAQGAFSGPHVRELSLRGADLSGLKRVHGLFGGMPGLQELDLRDVKLWVRTNLEKDANGKDMDWNQPWKWNMFNATPDNMQMYCPLNIPKEESDPHLLAQVANSKIFQKACAIVVPDINLDIAVSQCKEKEADGCDIPFCPAYTSGGASCPAGYVSDTLDWSAQWKEEWDSRGPNSFNLGPHTMISEGGVEVSLLFSVSKPECNAVSGPSISHQYGKPAFGLLNSNFFLDLIWPIDKVQGCSLQTRLGFSLGGIPTTVQNVEFPVHSVDHVFFQSSGNQMPVDEIIFNEASCVVTEEDSFISPVYQDDKIVGGYAGITSDSLCSFDDPKCIIKGYWSNTVTSVSFNYQNGPNAKGNWYQRVLYGDINFCRMK